MFLATRSLPAPVLILGSSPPSGPAEKPWPRRGEPEGLPASVSQITCWHPPPGFPPVVGLPGPAAPTKFALPGRPGPGVLLVRGLLPASPWAQSGVCLPGDFPAFDRCPKLSGSGRGAWRSGSLLYSPLSTTTTTSTRFPGVRKPATPEASSTFTVMARWLGLTLPVIPGMDSLVFSLVIRSPGARDFAVSRPTTCFTFGKEILGRLFLIPLDPLELRGGKDFFLLHLGVWPLPRRFFP